MSLLPTDIYTNQFQTISNISQNLSSLFINNSTIQTNRVVLDGNYLDTVGTGSTATLLLNGVAITSGGGLTSTIANWALYPAISTITFGTGGGSGGGVIMNTLSSQTVNARVGTFQQIAVSSINGQNPTQIGQTIAYRPTSLLSTNSINANTPQVVVTAFQNPVGPVVQGVYNSDIGGTIGVSNSSGQAPYVLAFISDNNVSPYAPISAVGGAQSVDFYPLGINGTTSGGGPVNTTLNLPFAFSNAGSNLYLIWQDQTVGGIVPTWIWSAVGASNISTNIQCIMGGGNLLAI
jgi:hypothetical protein